MKTPNFVEPPPSTLHVFEQEGAWHWGITIPRPNGGGIQAIAFSQETFPAEDEARTGGIIAMTSLRKPVIC